MTDPSSYSDLPQPSGSSEPQRPGERARHPPTRPTHEKGPSTDDGDDNGGENGDDNDDKSDYNDDDDDDTSSDEAEYDGHRPTPLDMRLSRTRTRGTARSASTVTTVTTSSVAGGGGGGGGRPPPPATTGSNLGRTLSRRSTAIISHIRSRPVPNFTHPLTHIPTTADSLVDFDGPGDPYKPLNWPLQKKITTTLLYGLVTMTATWASSCYSAGTAQIAAEFGVGPQVAVLGTSLFLVGFGLGPLLWAPLSEVYGRRLAVFVPMFVAGCFSFGSGASKDFQTLMLTRFWGAFFASAPVTNTGGVLGDLFGPAERGIAMAGYAMAVVAGPALGMFTCYFPSFVLSLVFFLSFASLSLSFSLSYLLSLLLFAYYWLVEGAPSPEKGRKVGWLFTD